MDRSAAELMGAIDRQWESLTLANDFVFGKVMLDEDICREVLETILGVPIERIEYVGREESVDESPESKGVRLDAYVRDGQGTVYDIEMQATNTRELPQRSRYYQAMLALGQLAKGRPYRSLKDSYVIFICNFDLFGQGRRVYTFEYREHGDSSLSLGDGTHTIFLAATSPNEPSKGERINELLDFVSTGEVTGELSSKLQDAVSHVLENQNWRLEYMWQEVRDQLNLDKGRELGFKEGREKGLEEGRKTGHEQGLAEGREQGLVEGRAAGESRFATLATKLIAEGRADDVTRAATDASFRDQLYNSYGIA